MTDTLVARRTALGLLRRIVREGAYSNVVVPKATEEMTSEDRAFATYLVYGVLRNLLRLDRVVDHLRSGRLDDVVRDVLRLGAFEILFSRTPSYAAVDTAVQLVAESGNARARGLVNAVLRRLVRDGEPELPSGDEGEALRWSQPLWFFRSLIGAWGRAEAVAFLEASQKPALLGVRVRDGNPPPGFEMMAGIPGAYLGSHPGGAVEGTLVQDPASVAVVAALDVRGDDRVLDVAAAPGGKTLAISDASPRRIVAQDRHPRRLRSARRRLGTADVLWVAADGTRVPARDRSFDKVLVDAPCTGLGTLRRRPEIRYRVSAGDPERLARVQKAMIAEGLRVLKPGGRLVYSVCTVTREETIDVAAAFDARPPEGLPGRPWGGGLLLAPHLTRTDGMFIAVIDA